MRSFHTYAGSTSCALTNCLTISSSVTNRFYLFIYTVQIVIRFFFFLKKVKILFNIELEKSVILLRISFLQQESQNFKYF